MKPTSLPVKLQSSNLRPIAYRILSKKHGLNIQTDALTILTDAVSIRFGSEWKGPNSQNFLENIAKIWKHQNRGLFIDGPGLSQVIKEIVIKDKHGNKSIDEDDNIIEKASRTDTLADLNEEVYKEELKIIWQDYFKIINPDKQPNYQFNKDRKQFGLMKENPNKFENNLKSSINYFNQRYFIMKDRLSRNENFQKKSFSSISKSNNSKLSNYEITLIKNVLGRDGSKFILFGLLSKSINGDFILEDSTDNIELNLTQTFKTEGSFYCTGMFLIVEGIYSATGGSMSNNKDAISGCFHVSNIGHPPVERREISLENYGNLDFMGINNEGSETKSNNLPIKLNKSLKKKLVNLEKSLINHKFLILGSNCFLDNVKVLTGLKKFFMKIEASLIDEIDEVPLVLVMVGSFISKPLTGTNSSISSISNSEIYKNNFDNLTDILSKFPNLIKKVKLVLIPGSNDPWISTYSLGGSNLNILPQKPISKVFINRLEKLLPRGNLILGWNPVRINYLSQEIVMIKDDLMSKFKRNDIIFESDLEIEKSNKEKQDNGHELNIDNININELHLSSKIKQARKLVKTLLDQGNLQPFLQDLKLVNTNFSHILRIEPLPNSIVLFDTNFENFEVTYNGCKVVNLSRLINNNNNNKINYLEYFPSGKKYEFKELYF